VNLEGVVEIHEGDQREELASAKSGMKSSTQNHTSVDGYSLSMILSHPIAYICVESIPIPLMEVICATDDVQNCDLNSDFVGE
jgi:hypothetical protein